MTIKDLIAKHTAALVDKDRYAVYRAAECEAWKAWYRSSGDAEHRDPGAAFMAIAVAEAYHSGKDLLAA